jgi:uncharacterized small protein (DUF1192 family)
MTRPTEWAEHEVTELRAEVERLRWYLGKEGKDWLNRHTIDRTEIERLSAQKAKLICDGCRRLGEVADDNERLKDELRAVLKHVEELRAEIERLNCALRRSDT